LLLAFEEKQLVLDFYLFSLVKNFSKIKILEAQKNLKFLNEFSLPKFPLNGEDLIKLGLKGEAVGQAIKKSKIFWAENNFKTSKENLLKTLKSNNKI
jgi:tRNA nucleotidyltransferase/poly(A) polymerase